MKKPATNQQKITCDVHQLAGILGLTPRSIQNLEKQGIAVRVAHGKYDLGASVRSYITILEGEAAAEDSDFEIQRTRVYRARAEILEAQSQAMRGELHEAGCIMEVMGDALANFRAKMLAIPTRLAPILADESDPNRCAEIIRDAVYEALSECSKYNAREVVARYIAKQGKARTQIEDEDQKADL